MSSNDTVEAKPGTSKDARGVDVNETDATLNAVIDGTKTMVISKKRTQPNLPQAQTDHHRPGTSNANDNQLSHDISHIVQTAFNSHQNDDKSIRRAIKHGITFHKVKKDFNHAEELRIIRRNNEIMRQQLRRELEVRPSPSEPVSTVSDEDVAKVECLKAELREKHVENLQVIGALAKEAQKFTDASDKHSEDSANVDSLFSLMEKNHGKVKERYAIFLSEAQRRCELNNSKIDSLEKKHNEDISRIQNSISSKEIAIEKDEREVVHLTEQRDHLLEAKAEIDDPDNEWYNADIV